MERSESTGKGAVLFTVLFSVWDMINHVFRPRGKKAQEEEKMQVMGWKGEDKSHGVQFRRSWVCLNGERGRRRDRKKAAGRHHLVPFFSLVAHLCMPVCLKCPLLKSILQGHRGLLWIWLFVSLLPASNSYAQALIPNVIVLEAEAFGR